MNSPCPNQILASADLAEVVLLSTLYAAYRVRLTLLIPALAVLLSCLLSSFAGVLARSPSGQNALTSYALAAYRLWKNAQGRWHFAVRQTQREARANSLLWELVEKLREDTTRIVNRVGEQALRYAEGLVLFGSIGIPSFLFSDYRRRLAMAFSSGYTDQTNVLGEACWITVLPVFASEQLVPHQAPGWPFRCLAWRKFSPVRQQREAVVCERQVSG